MNFGGKLTFDCVHECSDMFHLTFIKNVAMETLTIYNFCMTKFPKTLKNKGKEQTGLNSFIISVLLIISVSQLCWFPLIVAFQLSRYFLLGPNVEILAEQKGVIRSNCIDCLDRTNVTQVIDLVLGSKYNGT